MTTEPIDEGYDVVIAGARVAGAATAMLLARQGARVLVVDPVPPERDPLSTHGLMRAGVLQLHRWGLLDAIRRAGTPPIADTVFHYGAESLEIPLRPSDGLDALCAPRRPVLDRVLADAARAAGARVVYGAAVVELIRDPRGRVRGATIQRSGRHGGGPSIHQVRARLVIGADGMRSRVARLVRAPVEHRGRHAAAVVYGYWPSAHAGAYHWYYGDRAYAGAIPTNAGESCVFFGMPPAEFRAHRSEGLVALLPRVLDRVPAAAPEVRGDGPRPRLRGFPGVRGFLRRPVGPGWALVGDAGCFKDPSTAHGITDAFRDAELLARAVLRDTDEAMAGYRDERDASVRGVLETTDRIAALDWDMDRIRELHLQLNADMKVGLERVRRLGDEARVADPPASIAPGAAPGRPTRPPAAPGRAPA